MHRCHSAKCPAKEHKFADRGFAHICGVSDTEYWMVKAKVIVERKHFEFLNLPYNADVIVAEIYGNLAGELMRLAPEAFTRQVKAINVLN